MNSNLHKTQQNTHTWICEDGVHLRYGVRTGRLPQVELAGGAPGSVLSSFFHLNSTENQRGRLESCCDLPQLTQLK